MARYGEVNVAGREQAVPKGTLHNEGQLLAVE